MKSILLTLSTVFVSALLSPAEDTLEFKTLTARAGGGDAAAQLDLAYRYRDGKGIARDDAEAMKWAHRAADRGHAEAMDFIGFAYLRCAVVERSPEIAVGYFRAAAPESAQAAYNLGQCYFGAQGTEQDIPKALDWWKKAAAKGHGRAASTVAMALLSGEGVSPDMEEARRRAERAVELNDPSGFVVLAACRTYLLNPKNLAIRILRAFGRTLLPPNLVLITKVSWLSAGPCGKVYHGCPISEH